MDNYYIDLNTGADNEWINTDDVEIVKDLAVELMCYTQQDIKIFKKVNDEWGQIDDEWEEILLTRWIGCHPEEDTKVLMCFGDFGYYSDWIEL